MRWAFLIIIFIGLQFFSAEFIQVVLSCLFGTVMKHSLSCLIDLLNLKLKLKGKRGNDDFIIY